MAACVVVADDLTGANATGVLLTKMQYRAATIMSLKDMDPEQVQESDCLLYPTDSRGVDPQEAYRRVYEASERLKDDSVLLYGKRIDSTLRGNLGSELSRRSLSVLSGGSCPSVRRREDYRAI